jgi:hypothetical protein
MATSFVTPQAFLGVIDMCRSDMYLHPHTRYYMRELRLVAYNQVRGRWGDLHVSATTTVGLLPERAPEFEESVHTKQPHQWVTSSGGAVPRPD